jgi:hypothetical protein
MGVFQNYKISQNVAELPSCYGFIILLHLTKQDVYAIMDRTVSNVAHFIT